MLVTCMRAVAQRSNSRNSLSWKGTRPMERECVAESWMRQDLLLRGCVGGVVGMSEICADVAFERACRVSD
jgi:hypothetical protein